MPERPYERAAVLNLQRYLLQLSFFEPLIPPVPLDGIFDTATRDAVKAFQVLNNLPATGRADRTTWDMIYRAYLQSLDDHGRPEPVFIFPRHPELYSVGLGDTGALITAIQFLLRELIIEYGWEPEDVPVTGIFDEDTEQAVRHFQSLHSLPVSGRVDQATWNKMVRSINIEMDQYPSS